MFIKRLLNPKRWPSIVVFGMVLIGVFFLSGVIVSLVTHLMGSREVFAAAKQAALPWLFLWRWACYAGLIVAWLRVWKPRVLKHLAKDRDGGEAARGRLKRLEILTLIAMAGIELFNTIDWLGGDT
ncbi:hypothetical protein [Kushneria indalinina]|uniref:Uncharacterized protein n=1 Tax=Kushneria indalinina DSM 14324 TaxID=1122140 RepID=A0A3D9DSJ0_9GAMM|nr:hypothetical protein [Kushneria indalinina]REC93374.1 hypothetical protein C8D72_3418 [Kushneria indalinina DSM 14324]